jgi:hypothetical protein
MTNCDCCGPQVRSKADDLRGGAATSASGSLSASKINGSDRCTLGAAELIDRLKQWSHFLERSALGLERKPGSLVVRFQGTALARKELNSLVTLERGCCSHMSWAVTQRGSELLLTVGGSDAELDMLRFKGNE